MFGVSKFDRPGILRRPQKIDKIHHFVLILTSNFKNKRRIFSNFVQTNVTIESKRKLISKFYNFIIFDWTCSSRGTWLVFIRKRLKSANDANRECTYSTIKWLRRNWLNQNLQWKLGQQAPSFGTILAFLDTKTYFF